MRGLFFDIRYALRTLTRGGLSTAVAMLSLVVGVGPNIAMFAVGYAMLSHPLPYPGADRLVMLRPMNPAHAMFFPTVAPANLLDWQAQAKSFEAIWRQCCSVLGRSILPPGSSFPVARLPWRASRAIFRPAAPAESIRPPRSGRSSVDIELYLFPMQLTADDRATVALGFPAPGNAKSPALLMMAMRRLSRRRSEPSSAGTELATFSTRLL